MRAPRRRPAVRILRSGGFTFAEHPEREAPEARVIWRAEIDPGAIPVRATPIEPGHPDAFDPAALRSWLAIASDETGEHVVLSDGWRHIRLDLLQGSLASGRPVLLHYEVAGLDALESKLMPLRRLADLCRHRRFSVSLYPQDRRVARWMMTLRVHDGVQAGASQSEIARVLFGPSAAHALYADAFRSRVRRLVREAAALAVGGYRQLMRPHRR